MASAPTTSDLRTAPITTQRLVLRPIKEADLKELNVQRADPEVLKWTFDVDSGDNPSKFNTPNDWLPKNINDPKNPWFLICLRPNNSTSTTETITGYICTRFEKDLGFCIGKQFWGQGLATEAAKAYMQRFWEIFPEKQELRAGCHGDNKGSGRVLEKTGFQEWVPPEGKVEEDAREFIIRRGH
ncbi:MAG: hypothetical protein M1834_005223 [Cirrosporium novae-zelandiae]|nr:MAG: hypothetical protein M1834_005223 [Cirrosporium novae-zelandiae]